jgi:ferredoxin
VDENACLGCTICADFCQFGALTIEGEKAVVAYEKCMGCGVCVNHCPEEGIHLQNAPEKGIPLIISELMASAVESQ